MLLHLQALPEGRARRHAADDGRVVIGIGTGRRQASPRAEHPLLQREAADGGQAVGRVAHLATGTRHCELEYPGSADGLRRHRHRRRSRRHRRNGVVQTFVVAAIVNTDINVDIDITIGINMDILLRLLLFWL